MSQKPDMPLAPFQQWLNRKVEQSSLTEVARMIGVDESRIRCVLRGDYNSRKRQYKMEFLTLRLVDRWATAFGDHYLEIYQDTSCQGGRSMRAPTMSIFRSRQWFDRDRCAFGGPRCHGRPDPGRRFCPEHTDLFARIRTDLGNTATFIRHDHFEEAA